MERCSRSKKPSGYHHDHRDFETWRWTQWVAVLRSCGPLCHVTEPSNRQEPITSNGANACWRFRRAHMLHANTPMSSVFETVMISTESKNQRLHRQKRPWQSRTLSYPLQFAAQDEHTSTQKRRYAVRCLNVSITAPCGNNGRPH